MDLVFFNLQLNCYVVFEIKARAFDPKDMGQLQLYMQLINKHIKKDNHNPTIGIIVCKEKDRTVVEYMLEQTITPVGVATYNKYSDLPTEYAQHLPNEQEIINRLSMNG